MKSFAFVVAMVSVMPFAVAAQAERTGASKPSAWITDFNKRGEAYNLQLGQIALGHTQQQVISEFGKKYEVTESHEIDGQKHEAWKFTSYRARQFTDPVDSIVLVAFVDGLVARATQTPVGDSDLQLAAIPIRETPAANRTLAERLVELQALLEAKLITQEEFDAKRIALLEML